MQSAPTRSKPLVLQSNDGITRTQAAGVTIPLPVYNHTAAFQGLVFVSGIQGLKPGTFEVPTDVREEVRQMMHNLDTVLQQAKSSLQSMIKATLFFRDLTDFPAANEIINEFLPQSVAPGTFSMSLVPTRQHWYWLAFVFLVMTARSTVAVKDLPRMCRVVIDVIAVEAKPRL